jgi:hypothetical protein
MMNATMFYRWSWLRYGSAMWLGIGTGRKVDKNRRNDATVVFGMLAMLWKSGGDGVGVMTGGNG